MGGGGVGLPTRLRRSFTNSPGELAEVHERLGDCNRLMVKTRCQDSRRAVVSRQVRGYRFN